MCAIAGDDPLATECIGPPHLWAAMLWDKELSDDMLRKAWRNTAPVRLPGHPNPWGSAYGVAAATGLVLQRLGWK